MARMSIATIDSPEFINITPYNPLISECEIKVLYIGENRNHSYISKEVATEMANTLPGCPIVGYYREEKQDFGDHGERITCDIDGVHFSCLTKPYGFVAPNAKVWFQKFEDTDEFGNVTIREYLMTTGYLWTGQFEEAQRVIDKGNPHSMELDEDTLDGKWSQNLKTNTEFFIINDAIFSKLCILGEDIEPCFEGSSVTAPEVSSSFTKEVSSSFTKVDDNFKKTLYSMMQELKVALEGGEKMDNDKNNTNFSNSLDNNNKTLLEENQKTTETSFNKKDEENKEETSFAKEDEKTTSKESDKKDEKESKDKKEDEKEESNKDKKKDEDKYALLQSQYSELKEKYNTLLEFKKEIENEKKDSLIASFYMLSDEDKKDVITNKEKYSLDDIESKLSVICVRKKVNFDLENTSKNDKKIEEPITTFNLNDEQGASTPAWIKAIKNTQKNRDN